MAEPLLDLFQRIANDPDARRSAEADPHAFLADAGWGDLPDSLLGEALVATAASVPADVLGSVGDAPTHPLHALLNADAVGKDTFDPMDVEVEAAAVDEVDRFDFEAARGDEPTFEESEVADDVFGAGVDTLGSIPHGDTLDDPEPDDAADVWDAFD